MECSQYFNSSYTSQIQSSFAASSITEPPLDVWYSGGGASSHMTGNLDLLQSVVTYNSNQKVIVGNGNLFFYLQGGLFLLGFVLVCKALPPEHTPSIILPILPLSATLIPSSSSTSLQGCVTVGAGHNLIIHGTTTTSSSTSTTSTRPSPPSENVHPITTQRKVGTFKPRHIVSLVITSSIGPSSLENVPPNYTEALKLPHWRKAMSEEYNALIKNQAWTLIPPAPSQNLIGCKWIFKTQMKSDGTIERYKIKPTTIRFILSKAFTENWPIHQLDIKNAFLNGQLHEKVHPQAAPSFVHPDYPNHVCLLQKSLHGLKQAPRV
ncbi:hypothetical protein LIER_34787 [Lithospermum erythrorhizon]|uniref:Reverse transcriptase Ty1/copia-type domain-containing protein n=1 Tax=Lithospermum erythrorhizon TaxID=34254 RepID=A0AAV3S2K3_LITER